MSDDKSVSGIEGSQSEKLNKLEVQIAELKKDAEWFRKLTVGIGGVLLAVLGYSSVIQLPIQVRKAVDESAVGDAANQIKATAAEVKPIRDEILNDRSKIKVYINQLYKTRPVAFSEDSGGEISGDNQVLVLSKLTVQLETTGRPVFVGLIGSSTATNMNDASSLQAKPGATRGAANNPRISPVFLRDSEVISAQFLNSFVNNANTVYLGVPLSAFDTIDQPPPGKHIYTFQIDATYGSTALLSHCKLVAYEL